MVAWSDPGCPRLLACEWPDKLLRGSGKEGQGLDVGRPDNREMAVVESGNLGDVEALRDGDDGGVGRAQWQVTVLEHKICHPAKILPGQVDGVKSPSAIDRRKIASARAPPSRLSM